MTTIAIHHWQELDRDRRVAVLSRPAQRGAEQTAATAREIIDAVRSDGDAALRDFARQFDDVELDRIAVDRQDIEAAPGQLGSEQIDALRLAIENVRRFHAAQRRDDVVVETQPGLVCRQLARPIPRVGLYVPGGAAPLPSTLLMLAVPAELAGCARRIVCSPPQAGEPSSLPTGRVVFLK